MVKEGNYQVIISELVRRSNEDTRRLRLLEQKTEAIEDRIAALEDSVLDRSKQYHLRFTKVDETLRRANEDMITIKNSIDKINKQVASFARKRDIKEIEKMLELLNPEEDIIELRG